MKLNLPTTRQIFGAFVVFFLIGLLAGIVTACAPSEEEKIQECPKAEVIMADCPATEEIHQPECFAEVGKPGDWPPPGVRRVDPPVEIKCRGMKRFRFNYYDHLLKAGVKCACSSSF